MASIIAVLLQVAFYFIKMWLEGRDDKEAAEAEAVRLADEALKTGDTKPLRAFIAKLRADRKARRG